MSIYRDCDIRGRYTEQLKNKHAYLLGQAIVEMAGKTKVIVCGDARTSTPDLKKLLIKSLLDGGCHVYDIGVLPTPVFYFARFLLGVKTGVMVTASHNPKEYNGFKIILGEMPITRKEMDAIQRLMESKKEVPKTQGMLTTRDVLSDYFDFAGKYIENLEGLKTILDYGNGVGSITGKKLWGFSKATTINLFDEIDGTFPNRPSDPAKAENLQKLCSSVINNEADLGIAYDGDADRVAFVDELGQVVSNDKIIALISKWLLSGDSETIVYDQKCSQIVPEIIKEYKGHPVMERSGHTYIKRTFLERNAIYAGELSGHHFFRFFPQGDDGILSSLVLAKMLKYRKKSLSELINKLPSYPITPDIRLPCETQEANRIINKIRKGLEDEAKVTTLDGVRAEYSDGWGMARKSVTGPLITLRFEGKNRAALQRIISRFEEVAPELQDRLTNK